MLRSLFVDFNSYFASVEQQMQPHLRGKPVAVVPVMAETTCCIALSREAKNLGLNGGLRLSEARRACPQLQVVEARPPLYVEIHHALKDAIDSCVPVDSEESIDEMHCKLTGKWQQREVAIQLAKEVKQAIVRKVGPYVRCSIGIGPNMMLAKAATDMEKIDGLVVIDEHELPERLYTLELRDLSGIGRRMEARLSAVGIRTIEQLWRTPRAKFRKIWGTVEGERMHDSLHGQWVPRLEKRKSLVSHSHVLSPAQRNDEDARAVILRLLQKAVARLHRIRHYACGLSLFIEYLGGGGFSTEVTFLESQDTLHFIRAFKKLWQQRPYRPEPPMMVGIGLFDLVAEENFTPSLFEHEQTIRRTVLSHTVNELNARFGRNKVYFAGAHTALDSAPMRIAFNYVPEHRAND
ncbi:MAG: hypothetical protein QM796_21805 [Chthoniobacteraceae bacterium]